MEGIDSITISTDEHSVTLTPDEFDETVNRVTGRKKGRNVTESALQVEEEKLLEVEPDVTEFEFAITGATGFEGGKDVHVEDVVSISLGAECVGVRIEKRTRKGEDVEEEYLVRKVILKATGARIK